MTITTTEPTSGQFVAMWEHKGLLWCESLRINSRGDREMFIESYDGNEYGDEWVLDDANYPHDTEVTFYQL